jgi:spore coat polysaccharide biosynthesis protein SpsF (cytidylyltransferase family)
MKKVRNKTAAKTLGLFSLGAVIVALAHQAAFTSTGKLPAPADERIVAILFSVWQTREAKTEFRDVPNLDLLEIQGMPMIMHVYQALRGSRYIDKIVIFAAPEVEKRLNLVNEPNTAFVIDKGDAAENAQIGVGEVAKGDLVMFIPSDLVLVTSEGLDELIERVRVERGVDVIFPLVSREACERTYPEEARTYGRFREGQFTGAHVEFLRPDLFLENTEEVTAQKDQLYNLYYMRKSTFGAARFLGVKLSLKYIFGALSVRDIEEHVLEKYEVTAKAIFWEDPDLATDLSEPADIHMIGRTLQRRAAAHSRISPERSEASDRS